MRTRPHTLARRLALALTILPSLAAADEGLWTWFEYRLPVVGRADTPLPHFEVRLSTDTRFFIKTRGLDEGFLRVALLLKPSRWFYVAVAGAFQVDRDDATLAYRQETRLELEPHFTGRIGPITYDDRNRLEYRHRMPAATADRVLPGFDRVRYRNLLRVAWEPRGAKWIPFVSNEWLFNLDVGFDQNRLFGGLGRKLADNIRLDVAYMWRTARPSRTSGFTINDHILVVYLFVDIPARPAARR